MPKHRRKRIQQSINEETKFDNESVLIINQLKLKSMLFIEVFPNLQILDLAENKISKIEGFTHLRWVKKIDLSNN